MKETLSEKLALCYTGAVYDVLRSMGYPQQVLPASIRPLHNGLKIAGPVFTVEGKRDNAIPEHESLLQWCTMLSKAEPGHVVICQPNDKTVAHMGELSAETFMYKKIKGYIVNGGCRDSAQVERTGLPVFCEYYTPVDVVGKWRPTAFGQPVQVGDVTIATGDYVLADRDGIIIIPVGIAEEAVSKTEEVLRQENKVRRAILQGTDPVEAYLQYGKF